MWTQMEHVAEELRPDRCGIIFDRIADDVISARIDGEMTDLIMAQIQSFGREGFSVIVFNDKGYEGFLHSNHNQDYVMDVVRGRANIH